MYQQAQHETLVSIPKLLLHFDMKNLWINVSRNIHSFQQKNIKKQEFTQKLLNDSGDFTDAYWQQEITNSSAMTHVWISDLPKIFREFSFFTATF